jgi:carboxypeptidase T
VASATLHTFWPAAVFPWGLSTQDTETPYTPIFMKMVQVATSASQYQIGNSTEVIYPADGTFEDFAFWNQGVWSILFEAGRSHSPSLKDLETLVKQNTPGLRQMFEIAPKTRAEKHEFTGQCSTALRALDMHIE